MDAFVDNLIDTLTGETPLYDIDLEVVKAEPGRVLVTFEGVNEDTYERERRSVKITVPLTEAVARLEDAMSLPIESGAVVKTGVFVRVASKPSKR